MLFCNKSFLQNIVMTISSIQVHFALSFCFVGNGFLSIYALL
jgi:hypothetical protein